MSEEHEHEDGEEGEEREPPPRLSWREATYRFPPLRNALGSGALLLAGLIVEWTGGPDAVALALFLIAIALGAWYFAREALEELVEEREIAEKDDHLALVLQPLDIGRKRGIRSEVVHQARASAGCDRY